MLDTTELIGFGAGGEDIPPITAYANTFNIYYPSTVNTFNGYSLLSGTKTLVFGIMQHDNGGRHRYTTNVTVNGLPATLRGSAYNGYEYCADMSFWEIQTSADTMDLVIYNNGGGSHGMGVARMWTFPKPLGTPADSVALIYTNTSGVIDKYKDGVVLALANGFAAGVYIGGIPASGYPVWVNGAAAEIPTATVTNAAVSYGSVTQYYNQMMYALSWTPPA